MGGGLLDYTVSFLGQVIAIVISRPRSLTNVSQSTKALASLRDDLLQVRGVPFDYLQHLGNLVLYFLSHES